MKEDVIEDRLTDHNTGERRLVGELATYICEWWTTDSTTNRSPFRQAAISCCGGTTVPSERGTPVSERSEAE